ncbi:MAG: carboxymuconolactone decarboxylase family protein [Desulfobacteraceae bacterium]|nr:carboxymuconolactone decarboxylase family protein [Desulfobacteraceae bacterium]
MSKEQMPKNYQKMQTENPKVMQAVSDLGQAARAEGPLDAKTVELIQMAGAAALKLEGAVHSHTRRALDAGATREEIKHTLIVLTSTIGFPTVAAAMSWMRDITGE